MSHSMSWRAAIILWANADEIASGSGKLCSTMMWRSPRCASSNSSSSSALLFLRAGALASTTAGTSRSLLLSLAFIFFSDFFEGRFAPIFISKRYSSLLRRERRNLVKNRGDLVKQECGRDLAASTLYDDANICHGDQG